MPVMQGRSLARPTNFLWQSSSNGIERMQERTRESRLALGAYEDNMACIGLVVQIHPLSLFYD